ncbi:hypothetical protein F751_1411 [Auxenochlorella protothecoides]|uniref:Uncharacterized protein n=1 Tax=Auxenochlorella protothecoides TaxID=3075 RepID=A0A087SEJ2_AUXPR|nr:hypothetical protein F751_1411 [Auxenochlorella protothecoides]KFM24146.1 hypothetical protein F751_1411 [Auxenochlorella protothecoides]
MRRARRESRSAGSDGRRQLQTKLQATCPSSGHLIDDTLFRESTVEASNEASIGIRSRHVAPSCICDFFCTCLLAFSPEHKYPCSEAICTVVGAG